MLLQIETIDFILEKAIEQGFSFFLLMLFCVYMYMRHIKLEEKIRIQEEKIEKLQIQLNNTYKEGKRTDEYLGIITQHLRNKNYEVVEQEIYHLQQRRKNEYETEA